MGSAASTEARRTSPADAPIPAVASKTPSNDSAKSKPTPSSNVPSSQKSSHDRSSRTAAAAAVREKTTPVASVDLEPLIDLPAITSDAEEKPAISNNKLKKMALGIQGYKDQQRDYDETLSTLDVNKTAQIQWSEPKPEEMHSSPTRRPVVPPSPSRPEPSLFSTPTGKTPLHTPTHSHYGGFPNGRPLDKTTPLHGASSSPLPSSLNSSAHELPTVSSFSRAAPPTDPQRSIPGAASGPPGNIPVRPFPRSSDPDDLMYATFAAPANAETDSQRTPQRPQNVPVLNFPHVNSAPMPRGAPPMMMTSGMPMQPMQPMQMQPRPFATPIKAAPFPGGSPPPRGMTPVRPFTSPGPGMMHPAIGGFAGGPRSMPASPAVPVVKETTVVKRNKVELPTNLNHAKPTAGDWLNKRYFVNNYILLDTLGVGSYGEVRLCKDRNTEKLYAMKIISKDFLKKKKQGKSDETYFEDIKREIAIMKKLLHPNILRLFEVLDDPKVNKMYLLLEYMKRGDLINVLKKRGGADPIDPVTAESQFSPLSDFEVWNITRQLVAGIRYLHFQNIIHGDIKPQNLLVGEDGIVKVADFGISRMLSASSQQLQDAGGTPAFMSPELIENQTSFSGQLADVWAMGATVFMLRFGKPPWVAKSIINLYHKICNEPLVFPGPIDPGLQNLLEGMLEKDPQRRLTLPQIVMHPWYLYPPPNVLAKPSTASAKPGNVASSTPSASLKASAGSSVAIQPVSFQPPASYESEEAAAMNKPPNEIDQQDLYMSIGGGATRVRVNEALRAMHNDDPFASTVEDVDLDEDDDDDDDAERTQRVAVPVRVEAAISGKNEDNDNDVMKTNWGADVFGIVEEDVDLDDDDDDDESDEKEKAFGQATAVSASSSNDKAGETKKMQRTESQHNEMTEEEEARRSMQFLKKVKQKSSTKLAPSPSPSPSPVKTVNGAVFFPPQFSNASLNDSDTEKVVTVEFSSPSRPPALRSSNSSSSVVKEEDESLTSEDFHKMMDTLSQQNIQQRSRDAAFIDEQSSIPREMISNVLTKEKNTHTGVGCAMHTEVGVRSAQEDRAVVFADAASLLMQSQSNLSGAAKEKMSWFTLACLFDGHNGSRTAQYLAQHLPSLLVSHEQFLDHKRMGTAVLDVCSMIDFQICEMLREEENSSGSTALIVIYDGKRQVLTVAGLGDSLCVLSRNGKVVEMNSIHRMNNAKERERVINSGGKVIGNRVNGVLAVSRAFGDTQFKSPPSDEFTTGSNILSIPHPPLVLAEPELRVEHITPRTEFAIIATDGLWDVMIPQLAVSFLRSRLIEHRDLQRATKELVTEALHRGSIDNVTVIVLTFNLPLKDNEAK